MEPAERALLRSRKSSLDYINLVFLTMVDTGQTESFMKNKCTDRFRLPTWDFNILLIFIRGMGVPLKWGHNPESV